MDGLHEGDLLAGRYTLLKSLRSGGSAVVWLALDQTDKVEVALKIRAAGALSELEAEFETLKKLRHPAIVVANNLATANGVDFLVLDLIDGGELGQYRGADYRIWLPMLRPVIKGLEYAHDRGVVHGDLKPENLLIRENHEVCLVDFERRPGKVAADDIRDMAAVMTQLATGLAETDFRNARIPAALVQLIKDMTNDADAITFTQVADRIDEVLSGAMSRTDAEQFERIEPVARQTDAARRPAKTSAARASVWPWVAVAIAGAAVIVKVILMLSDNFLTNTDTEPSASSVATDRVDEARARLDSLAEQTRLDSAAVYQKWLSLEAINVSSWAELRAGRAFELLTEGERLATDLDYVAALRTLKQSDEIFAALLKQAPGIASDRREAGWLAYHAGDAQSAAEHFRVALAIEPDHDEVRAALRRTAYLGEINTLTRRARVAQQNDDLPGALAALNEVLLIDSDNKEVELEIAGLTASIESSGFQSTMSQFYTALNSKKFKQARRLLERASTQRPGAPEVRDASTQLQVAERAAATATLRARAVAAEGAENWETAIELYSQLLAVDQALVLAQQGRDRSRRLAALNAKAERLLATALTNDNLRLQVATLLEQIGSVTASAPTLQKRALQLENALHLSRVPVKVQFQSDNQTEIQVQRVARLGSFESHELTLLPGQYTIVGTRPGYRDVRTKFVVEAGKEPTPLVIRCEEQI